MTTKQPKPHADAKTHNVKLAKGGEDKMFGKQQAAPKRGGLSGKPDVRGPGKQTAAGGRNHMRGFVPAKPATAGHTAPALSEGPLRPRSVRNDYTKRPR